MKGKIKLFRLGVAILSVSFAGTVLAAAGDILDDFSGLPGKHAHGGAAFGGLVWESASTNRAIIEFTCDGEFIREIPSPVGGFNSGLAYDSNTNTFWHANGFNTIFHLDINGNLLGTIAAGSGRGREIYALTLDPNTQTLWGGRRGFIHQYDIATGNFLRTISIPTGSSFPSLGFDGQFLWVSGFGTRRVWQIDPDAAVPILQTFIVTGSGGVVAHDSQDLWTFNEGTNQIQRVDDGIGPSGLPCFRGVVEVDIDIKPGSDPNGVNPRSKGVIPVAVLGSVDFDATQVDSSTVEFGPDEASAVHDGHVEDVNDDGFADMVFHFVVGDTGIECGATDATLTGETFGGDSITGTDMVKTAGCN